MRWLFLVLVASFSGCLGAFEESAETTPKWSQGTSWAYVAGNTEVAWTVGPVETINGTPAYRVSLSSEFWNETRWYATESLAMVGRESFGIRTQWVCDGGPFPLEDKTYRCARKTNGAGNTDPHRIRLDPAQTIVLPVGGVDVIGYRDTFDGGSRVFGSYWYAPQLGVWAAYEESGVLYELSAKP